MAAIDDLLARITDPALRADLAREVDVVRSAQSLGLVFERHLPETLQLPSHPVRRGAVVVDRSVGEGPRWTVASVRDGHARLGRFGDDGELIEDERAVASLAVVKRFDDPIYPGLRECGSVENGGSEQPAHVVIRAENAHALELLRYTHAQSIDVVYIDPPYNSGSAKDWKYNNNYVSGDDRYRHSKWLAMMERRLLLAKDLLRPDNSVLIVSIDENEVHRLSLLLEDLFPSSKVQMVTVLINKAGVSIIDQFDRVDEHLLFVHVGNARPIRTVAETTPEAALTQDVEDEGAGGETDETDEAVAPKKFQWEGLQRSGGNSRRRDTKEKFFPIYINEDEPRIVGCGESLPPDADRGLAEAAPDGCIAQWPIKRDGSEGCWQLKPETFRQYLDQGRVRLGRKTSTTGRWSMTFLTKGHMASIERGELLIVGHDERGALQLEWSVESERTRIGKTMWTHKSYNASVDGTKLLSRLLPGRRFPFPKSLYLMEDALRFYVGDKPDAVVLDFFAGSGTTAHALMRLNHQDGGRRQSISITNNEVAAEDAEALRKRGLSPGDPEWELHGIFEQVTAPRLMAAVTGRTPEGDSIDGNYRFRDEFPIAEGLTENVRFFDLTYYDADAVRLGRAFDDISWALWVQAGSVGPRVTATGTPWEMPAGGRYGVLFDPDHWPGFVAAATAEPEARLAFVVSDSDGVFQRIGAEMPPHIQLVRLYEAYLTSFASNRGQR